MTHLAQWKKAEKGRWLVLDKPVYTLSVLHFVSIGSGACEFTSWAPPALVCLTLLRCPASSKFRTWNHPETCIHLCSPRTCRAIKNSFRLFIFAPSGRVGRTMRELHNVGQKEWSWFWSIFVDFAVGQHLVRFCSRADPYKFERHLTESTFVQTCFLTKVSGQVNRKWSTENKCFHKITLFLQKQWDAFEHFANKLVKLFEILRTVQNRWNTIRPKFKTTFLS